MEWTRLPLWVNDYNSCFDYCFIIIFTSLNVGPNFVPYISPIVVSLIVASVQYIPGCSRYVLCQFTVNFCITVGITKFSLLDIICVNFLPPKNIQHGRLSVLVQVSVLYISVGIYLSFGISVGTCIHPIYQHNRFQLKLHL